MQALRRKELAGGNQTGMGHRLLEGLGVIVSLIMTRIARSDETVEEGLRGRHHSGPLAAQRRRTAFVACRSIYTQGRSVVSNWVATPRRGCRSGSGWF